MASMSRAPTSPRRSRKQRDRTVGRRRASWSAQRRIVTPAGGSSRVLSRADWASSFIRSALSMIATRAPPSTGMSSSSPTRSLTPRILRVRATDDDLATRSGRARDGGGRGGCRARPAGTPGRCGTAAHRVRRCTTARPRCRARGSSCRPLPGRRGGRPGARDPGSSWPPRRARRPAPGSGRLP